MRTRAASARLGRVAGLRAAAALVLAVLPFAAVRPASAEAPATEAPPAEARPAAPHPNLARIERMADGYRVAYPDVVEVAAADLLAEPDSARILVDVRDPEERAVSRIPGSVSREEFEDLLAREAQESPDGRPGLDGRRIVTYCTIGYRSGVYARELNERGFPAVNLRGSVLAWAHAGGPLVDDEGPTRRVHVYGRRWSLLPDGYQAVW